MLSWTGNKNLGVMNNLHGGYRSHAIGWVCRFVCCISPQRGITGVREEILELEDVSSISDLRTSIWALYPDLEAELETAVFAVNREIVLSDQRLSDDDEVAIFPPISGGHKHLTNED